MKRLFTIALLTIIFVQTFSSLVIEAEYFLNKDYIARVLCINKAKPAMQCEGKCYLAKQLKAQEQEESPVPKKEKFELQPFLIPGLINCELSAFRLPQVFHYYKEQAQSTFLAAVFHPPTV